MNGDALAGKKANRFRFMNALYERTDGDEQEFVDMWELGAALGLTREDTERIVQYLSGERLLAEVAMGGAIAITHYGVVQVERALSEPERPTQYFPPVVNIVHVGTMTGSNIQQAGPHSVVTSTMASYDAASLRELATQLRGAVEQLRSQSERAAEFEANVATLEAQLTASSPNSRIVQEALSTIRNVLEGMTGSLAASGLLHQISRLMGA